MPSVRPTAHDPVRRVPWGRFPDFSGTISELRLPVARPAALRLFRLAVPTRVPCSLPRGGGPPPGPGRFVWRPSVNRVSGGDGETSQVPGRPIARMPRSPTPADHPRQAVRRARCCLPPGQQRRLRKAVLSRLDHAACRASCVGFAAGVARGPRNTRFRLVASLGRSGPSTCWVAENVSVMSQHVFLLHQASPGAMHDESLVSGR